jgi:O-antigen/teichoic acid export membrane protein
MNKYSSSIVGESEDKISPSNSIHTILRQSFLKSLLLRLIKQSPGYSIAVVFPAITGFLLLPIFTHYISPSEYGIYALLQVVNVIFSIFASLGIPAIIPFYFTEEFDLEKRKRKLGNILLWISLFNLSLFVFFIIVGSKIFTFIFPTVEFYPYIVITLFSSIFSPYIDTPVVIWRMQEDAMRVAFMTLIKIFFISGFQLLFIVFMKLGLIGLLLGSLFGTAITAMVFMISIRKEISFFISRVELKKALRLGLPSIPNNIFVNAYRFADRVILERFVSHEILGLYYIALRFGEILRMGVDVFSQAWMPIFYKEAVDREKWEYIVQISTIIIMILGLSSLIIYFISEIFISIFIDSAFYKAIYLIPFVIFAQMLKGSYIFPHFSIWLSKKTYYFPIITLIPMLFSIIFNLYFIPIYGIYGASSVMVLSFFLHTIITYIIGQKVFPLTFDYTRIAIIIFFSGIIIFFKSAIFDSGSFSIRLLMSILLYGIMAIFISLPKLSLKKYI